MTVIEVTEEEMGPQEEPASPLSRMKLLYLAVVLVVIAVVWRQIDIFILGLGDTWMNILPNKLFTLLVMVGIFWFYRRSEIGPVLGFTRENIKAQLAVGVVVGVSMYLVMDALPVIVYGAFIDTSYPLELHIVAANMLWYQFLFFLCNGFVEEGLFRGVLQNGLREYVSPNRAILLSAVVFGVYHVCWPILKLLTGGFSIGETAGMLLFSGIAGGIFGIYYEKFSSRRSLMGPVAAHTLINFFNENFKIGPEAVTQGPDFTFGSPVLLGTMALFFFLFASILIVAFWKLRIEKLQEAWERLTRSLPTAEPSTG
ncbi:CPBP family intramembrane metalloprotease [Candidatus Thorarchaeota archaeon]|nr:MAG: CPBP family intramembrane metalloprotease [Candidatus Thorarchaeota archaeon]